MEIRRLYDIPKSDRTELEQKIVSSEKAITPEDIDDFVQHILQNTQHVAEKDRSTFIVDSLSNNFIASLFEQKNPEMYKELSELDEKEQENLLNSVMGRIRKAVIEGLKRSLGEARFFLISKELSEDKRSVNFLSEIEQDGGKYFMYRTNEALKYDQNARKAFEHYVSLGLQHPNIIPIRSYDNDTLATVVDKIDLESVSDILKNPDSAGYSFKDILRILLDHLSAAKYLISNGLVMQDISTDNLGIDNEQRKGIVFDLEGIYPLGEKREGRLCDKEYIPPELLSAEEDKTEITEEEMVYQYGMCLKKIIDKLSGADDGKVTQFNDLVSKMTVHKPQNRPKIGEVISTLIANIETIQ